MSELTDGQRTLNVVGDYAGWFAGGSQRPPRRWKQAIVVIAGLIPVSLLVTLARQALAPQLPLLAVVSVTAVCNVAALTWIVMPLLTAWLRPGSPVDRVLTTDPGTTRDTDRLADAVLPAMKDDLAGRTATTAPDAVGDRAARAGPRHRIRPPGSMASRSRRRSGTGRTGAGASPDHRFSGVFDVNVFAILAALTHMDVEQNMNTTFLTHQSRGRSGSASTSNPGCPSGGSDSSTASPPIARTWSRSQSAGTTSACLQSPRDVGLIRSCHGRRLSGGLEFNAAGEPEEGRTQVLVRSLRPPCQHVCGYT
jgi:hypothetical protein